MRKTSLVLFLAALLLLSGCKDSEKDLYLPEAENDEIYVTIGREIGVGSANCAV